MDENHEPAFAPEPGKCGEVAHIFEWASHQFTACPMNQKCFCKQVTYGEALLGAGKKLLDASIA